MSNEELAAAIQNGDQKAKEHLCRQNRGLIYTIARKFEGMGELEDRIQSGYIGLLEAAELFDQDKGTKFSTFAAEHIRKRIYRNSNTLLRLPEYMKVRVHQYNRFVERYRKERGTEPTDSVILAKLDINAQELQNIRQALTAICPDSLQKIIGGEFDDLTLQDTLQDPADIETEAIEAQYLDELQEAIWQEVAALPDDLADAIRARYKEGKALQDKAAWFREQRALKRLSKSEILAAFYDDIRSAALKGTGTQAFNQTWTSATERAALLLYERKIKNEGNLSE